MKANSKVGYLGISTGLTQPNDDADESAKLSPQRNLHVNYLLR